MPQHRNPFHSTALWQRTRRIARIEAKHTCARCKAFRPGKGELHVHHKMPVAKSKSMALERLNFEVLCPGCHNIVEPRTGSRISAACDDFGRPLDPNHPWFQKMGGAT
jgi:5-methylcytosine-specific restriction endonuclease McrA